MKSRWKPGRKTKEPENLEKAYEYAVFLLSLKLRTVGEVFRKMEVRGYKENIIEKVIGQLKEQKYLNDRQYAEIFLENLKTYRTFGFYGIKKKFMDKKLPSDIIENILEEGLSLKEEEKIARRLLKKEGYEIKKSSEDEEVTYRSFGDDEQNKEKQKMANRLKSRGFRSEIVAKLIF